jgi:hypothetical protein
MKMTHVLAPNLSSDPSRARARLRAPRIALCMLGLLGSALGCDGSIDDNQDVASSRPATNTATNQPSTARDTTGQGDGVVTGTASAADEGPTDISTRAQDNGDLGGIRGGSRSSGSRRGGGRALDPENTDAGALDAGEVDGGDAGALEADAGLIEVDAGADAAALP